MTEQSTEDNVKTAEHRDRLVDAALSAAVTIREAIDGVWDGNAEGWHAVADMLMDAAVEV